MPSAFQVIAGIVHLQSVPKDIWFLSYQQHRCGYRCRNGIGKNMGFDLFSFSVNNSEADSWIFMLIAHSNAPFIFAVAAGVIDNLTVTGIYSLRVIKK